MTNSTLLGQFVTLLHNGMRWLEPGTDLARCDGSERRRIMCDLMLTEADLRAAVLHGPERTRLLSEMMGALHLDPGTLAGAEPAVFRDLQRVCVWCNNSKRCRRDLEQGRIAAICPSYCSNRDTLAALATRPNH